MSLVTTKYFLFPWSKSSSSMLIPFCCGFLRLWTLGGGWCIKLQVASIIGNWHGILCVKTSFWSACSISRSLFDEYRGRYSERDSRLPQCIFRGTILWRFCEARLWVKQSRWFETDTNQESLGDKHAIMWMHVGPALLLLLHNTRNAWNSSKILLLLLSAPDRRREGRRKRSCVVAVVVGRWQPRRSPRAWRVSHAWTLWAQAYRLMQLISSTRNYSAFLRRSATQHPLLHGSESRSSSCGPSILTLSISSCTTPLSEPGTLRRMALHLPGSLICKFSQFFLWVLILSVSLALHQIVGDSSVCM